MKYESIRESLNDYYFGELPKIAEDMKNSVFAQMDEYDRQNPEKSSYHLKSKLYDTIADNIKPVIFDDLPFYFETGALVAFSDGKFDRGAIAANAWLWKRNEHLFADVDPEAYKQYRTDGGTLYCQTGTYVDTMHTGLPMKKIFKLGLCGILSELFEARESAQNGTEREFINCAVCGINTLQKMAMKLSSAARERKNYYLADMAERVPFNPPATFHEGLCTLAFIKKALGSIEGQGFNSFGRVDKLLAPLYESDVKKGVSREEMLSLTEKFLLIWDCTLDRREKMKGFYEYELENTLTLGGCDDDGKPLYNDVTRLFLDARDNLDCLYPKMMLRFSSESPKEYMERICSPLLAGKGLSLYENDDRVIPSLIKSGIDELDARDYVISGCWDALTPDVSLRFGGEYLNILRALEWAVHDDKARMQKHNLYFDTLENAKTFDELYSEYIGYIEKLLMRKAEPMSRAGRVWHEVNPLCTYSALMTSPIEKRRDITNGGGKYNPESVYFCGFSEIVDSLLAIKKLCFDEKICTVSELFGQCRREWEDEVLRQRAISAPSYGDGSEEASVFVGKFLDDLYRISRDLPTSYGGDYRIGFNQYTEIIWWGKELRATPNGRRLGDYISQGVTPSRLQRSSSFIDFLDSLRYFDVEKCAGNASMTVTLPAGKMTLDKLVSLFYAIARNNIQALQPNCVDREDLLAAQKNPENYGHIIVRVCGFSAPFVSLSEVYQNEVISRTAWEV